MFQLILVMAIQFICQFHVLKCNVEVIMYKELKLETFYDTLGSIYVDSPDYGGMKLEDFAHIADIYSKYKDEDNIIVVSDHFMSDHRSWHYKVMQLNHKVYISGIKYQDPNTGIEGLVEAYVINENDTLAEDVIHCRVIATGFMFTTTSDKIIKG